MQTFQWKKDVGFFSRIIERDKRLGTIYKGPKGILKSAVHAPRLFL